MIFCVHRVLYHDYICCYQWCLKHVIVYGFMVLGTSRNFYWLYTVHKCREAQFVDVLSINFFQMVFVSDEHITYHCLLIPQLAS